MIQEEQGSKQQYDSSEDFATHARILVETRLDELLLPKEERLNALYSAARHTTLASAKRIRPLFLLATLDALRRDLKIGLDVACALELVHTYSLVHDDLPCMDDDDLRRGKPTLHKLYNEGLAVLAGDFLLTYAFEVVASAHGPSEQQKVRLIATLASHAGDKGMVGGQWVDVEKEGMRFDQKTLDFIHIKKTAALFVAAMEMGAILADADAALVQQISAFAKQFGLFFQIVDDILDVTATQQDIGKPVGSDAAKEKTTYTSLLGVEKARMCVKRHYEQLQIELERLPMKTDFFAYTMALLHRRLCSSPQC
ncbi:polyprenyl synthetase family protein [Simkania negevensis]|uniref:Polyprenyl synthetase family protein n=1 Tax=Simkania negevensis TaxID=83561 RepID=A0ABS3AQM3_9BACT|nr:polyprenyl synthetase family protein [Simkania negevensis]